MEKQVRGFTLITERPSGMPVPVYEWLFHTAEGIDWMLELYLDAYDEGYENGVANQMNGDVLE